jgi:hypothetical protein
VFLAPSVGGLHFWLRSLRPSRAHRPVLPGTCPLPGAMVLPYRRAGAPRGMEGAGSICQAEATAAAVAGDWDSVPDEDFESFILGAGAGSFPEPAVAGMLSSLWEDMLAEEAAFEALELPLDFEEPALLSVSPSGAASPMAKPAALVMASFRASRALLVLFNLVRRLLAANPTYLFGLLGAFCTFLRFNHFIR